MSASDTLLGWGGIVRLGLVQAALGSVVVLTTSTFNRVMIVELMLPAMLPGALVALYYSVQMLRPRLGYGSDLGGRRTPWILGGMLLLAAGAASAAAAIALMEHNTRLGIGLAVLSFVVIGVGVGAAGTSLLVLIAKRVHPDKRSGAATIVWLMTLTGFIVTTIVVGQILDPFSYERLFMITASVGAVAFSITVLALWGVEGSARPPAVAPTDGAPPPPETAKTPFRQAFMQVWREPDARVFALFVFVSMFAYSAQNLILEPFAGAVFGYTPGESTTLSGIQNIGILTGMILVAFVGGALGFIRIGSMRSWMIAGCLASALGLFGLALAGFIGPAWPLRLSVFLLGAGLGVFAVAAIWSMMGLVGRGRERREGLRMGLWGAAQAVAFGLGSLLGTTAIDLTRYLFDSVVLAYATVFTAEALLFLLAGALAARVSAAQTRTPVDGLRLNP